MSGQKITGLYSLFESEGGVDGHTRCRTGGRDTYAEGGVDGHTQAHFATGFFAGEGIKHAGNGGMSEAHGLRDIEEGRTGLLDGGASLAVIAGGAALLYGNNRRFREGVDKTAGYARKLVGRPLLPKNWVAVKDEHDITYWHNTETGDDSRVIPRPEPIDPDAIPEPWEERVTAGTGKPYYWNKKTHKSTFERPKSQAQVKRNWIGRKITPMPPKEPPEADEPAAADAPPGKASYNSGGGRRAAGPQQTQPVPQTSKQQLKQAKHALEIAKLHAETTKLKAAADKRVTDQKAKGKGNKAKGKWTNDADKWAVVRTKTAALGKASSQLKELITHTERIGALNTSHPIHKFTVHMGEVTKLERRITAQRLQKLNTVEDVQFLKVCFQQTLTEFEKYASLDVAKAYKLDSIRTLLSECIAAVEAFVQTQNTQATPHVSGPEVASPASEPPSRTSTTHATPHVNGSEGGAVFRMSDAHVKPRRLEPVSATLTLMQTVLDEW